MTFTLDRFDLDAFVASTLAEDLGEIGDITSAAVIPADAMFSGVMDSRDDVVVAGLPLAEAFFRALDPDVEIEALVDRKSVVSGKSASVRVDLGGRRIINTQSSKEAHRHTAHEITYHIT